MDNKLIDKALYIGYNKTATRMISVILLYFSLYFVVAIFFPNKFILIILYILLILLTFKELVEGLYEITAGKLDKNLINKMAKDVVKEIKKKKKD